MQRSALGLTLTCSLLLASICAHAWEGRGSDAQARALVSLGKHIDGKRYTGKAIVPLGRVWTPQQAHEVRARVLDASGESGQMEFFGVQRDTRPTVERLLGAKLMAPLTLATRDIGFMTSLLVPHIRMTRGILGVEGMAMANRGVLSREAEHRHIKTSFTATMAEIGRGTGVEGRVLGTLPGETLFFAGREHHWASPSAIRGEPRLALIWFFERGPRDWQP